MKLINTIGFIEKHIKRCGLAGRACDCGAELDLAWQTIKQTLENSTTEQQPTSTPVTFALENFKNELAIATPECRTDIPKLEPVDKTKEVKCVFKNCRYCREQSFNLVKSRFSE